MTEAYISNLNYSAYSSTSKGDGSVSIHHDGNYTHFKLDEDDISQLKELAQQIISKKRKAFADAVLKIDVTPQLTYDSGKTIDNDDHPF